MNPQTMQPGMIIGFTGSQKGMIVEQCDALIELLTLLKPSEAHHGDCIGADAIFHEICLALKIPIVLHPPIDESKRAFCEDAWITHPAKEYLVRNHDIVNTVDLMFAVPNTREEKQRSGTWATYRYATKINKPLYLITP